MPCGGARFGSLYGKTVSLRWTVYHDQQGVHYLGHADTQLIVNLTTEGPNAGKIIDPNNPIQLGVGSPNQARVRVDGATDAGTDLGSPVITAVGRGTTQQGPIARLAKVNALGNS
jgi:hypothetical protein